MNLASRTLRIFGALGAGFVLSACISTQIQLAPAITPLIKPYDDYNDYYLLGFVGHPKLNLNKICGEQKVLAVRRLRTGEDVLIGLVTLGIYTPTTVRIWCVD